MQLPITLHTQTEWCDINPSWDNKGKAEFTWNEHYDQAFREAKFHIAHAVRLKYFYLDIPITIECGASGAGIEGTLLQMGNP